MANLCTILKGVLQPIENSLEWVINAYSVIYWLLTEPSIKRCTCVKKRNQVDIMKEYRQVPAAVELVGDRNAWVRASLQTEGCGPRRPPVEQLQPRCRRSAAWVNIAVCPCLHSSLTHHRNIENKVWERYFCKEVCSFVHWSCSSFMFAYICICIVHNNGTVMKKINVSFIV